MKNVLLQRIPILLVTLGGFAPIAAKGVPLDTQDSDRIVGYSSRLAMEVDIQGDIAWTTITQTLHVPSAADGVRLVFDLPSGAEDYTCSVNDVARSWDWMSAESGTRWLASAAEKSKNPALLAMVGYSLAQVPMEPTPNGEYTVTHRFRTQLYCHEGFCEYDLPLAGRLLGGQLELALNVKGSKPLAILYSPTLDLSFTRIDAYTARGYRHPAIAPYPERFRFFYSQTEKPYDARILTSPLEISSALPTAMVLLGSTLQSQGGGGRNLTFVVDRSGSMSSESKMDDVKKALDAGLAGLSAQDTFSVVDFADDIRVFSDEIVSGSPAQLSKARQYVSTLYPSGGTNIHHALVTGFGLLPPVSRPSYLVFLTDGQATAGVTDTEGILSGARQSNVADARLFAFGVGSGVNTILLDQLTNEHEGLSVYLRPGQNVEQQINQFLAGIHSPLLSRPRVANGSNDAILSGPRFPEAMGDLFAGSVSIQLGRVGVLPSEILTVEANCPEGPCRFTLPVGSTVIPRGYPFVARLHAEKHVVALIEEIELTKLTQAQRDARLVEIRYLVRHFGISSPFTDYMLRPPTVTRKDGVTPGATTGGPQLGSDEDLYAYLDQSSGASAYEKAESKNAWKNTNGLSQYHGGSVAVSNDKAFAPDSNGIWVDATFTPGQPIALVAMDSSGYTDWVASHPEAARLSAVAPNVLLSQGGRNWLVHDGTVSLAGDYAVSLTKPGVVSSPAGNHRALSVEKKVLFGTSSGPVDAMGRR